MTQQEALEILKMGESAFITGAAGSGKTHLLNEYIKYLRQAKAGVAITASTGIAATHLGGVTIHSWSGLGIADRLSKYDLENLLDKSYLRKRYEESSVLIIDEISMLHHFRLDLLDRMARAFKHLDQPFGGMQLILCGDFFQLPPVSRSGEPLALFSYHSRVWSEASIKVCYLTEQHRQTDQKYLEILNAIRDNKVTDEILSRLRSRFEANPTGTSSTKLYSHNANVDLENERELAKIPGNLFVYEMSHRGRKPLVEALAKSCLAPAVLRLKKNARVMFVKNNFEEGYVNGTLGVVEYCDRAMIKVRIGSGKVITVLPTTWMVEENDSVKASITQYPLRLAWAITVHKSQGMSLDNAEIDLSRSFEKGMGYVALSRVRNLAGLSLLGLNENALQVADEVMAYDQAFKEQSADHITWLENQAVSDRAKIKQDFLARIGGSVKAVKLKKASTTAETKKLLQAGLSIEEIAKVRNMTWGTIINHLEKIKKLKHDLDWGFVSQEIPHDRLAQIKQAILATAKENGEYRLSPVKAILGDEFSFEEIRLARLLVE